MACHHPSGHTLSKAFFSSGTGLTCFAVAEVLVAAVPARGFPVEMSVFGTDGCVEVVVIFESVFSVRLSFVRVAAAADPPDPLGFQQMCDPCVVLSCVLSHVRGQLSRRSSISFRISGTGITSLMLAGSPCTVTMTFLLLSSPSSDQTAANPCYPPQSWTSS